MNSKKRQARNAGVLYVLLAITGVYSLLYVPSTLYVFGDATATAENIRSSELIFRTGILANLFANIVFVFLVLALYRLLREIHRRQAVLMVVLVMISVATTFGNTISQIAALIMLSGADFLSVFTTAELEALAYSFLRMHSHGLQIIQVFWGLWLFPFGILVYNSRFIPRVFGVLLWIAGSGYVLGTLVFLLMPQYSSAISGLLMLLEVCELPIIFWLLIAGVKAQSGEMAEQRQDA